MGFCRRFVYMISLLFLSFILFSPSPLAFAQTNSEASVVLNSAPSESIDGTLKSFDISHDGKILLFFQDTSAYGICTVHILDSSGQFIVDYIVTSMQSGSVLACFDDTGDVLIYFVRADETYVIKDNALERVSVPGEHFWKVEVPPATQKENVSYSFKGVRYTLYSPGLFGSGYTLTRCLNSEEQLIWTGGADNARENINRSLLFMPMIFSIISIVCVVTALKDKHWHISATALIALHVFVIVAAWMLILLIESERCLLTWKSINSVDLLQSVLMAVAVMILCDSFLFCRAIKPAEPNANV